MCWVLGIHCPVETAIDPFPSPLLSGSSAGAGSEVFHVYRHLRRRENIRQQYIQENAEKDDLEIEFQIKLAQNQMEAEQRTSKKRAKRLSINMCGCMGVNRRHTESLILLNVNTEYPHMPPSPTQPTRKMTFRDKTSIY